METQETAQGEYQLGSGATELARLQRQGRVLAPATRAILEVAGVRSGMRVLDLGSGMGDMAFAAVELVGSTGERTSLRGHRTGLAGTGSLIPDYKREGSSAWQPWTKPPSNNS